MSQSGAPTGRVPNVTDDLWGRLKSEAYCLWLVFRFHDGNNHLRKAITIMLVFVWGTIFIALTLDQIPTTTPPFFEVFTALVWTIVGKMWGVELNNFAGGVIEQSSNDGEDTTDDTDEGDKQ